MTTQEETIPQENPADFETQIKEKDKELKRVKTILEKLEKKYKTLFKDNNAVIKDRETLEKFITTILPQDFQKKNIGEYEYEPLYETFIKNDEQKSQALQNVLKDLNKEKVELESKLKNASQQQVQNMDQVNKQIVDKLNKEIQDLQNQNTKYASQIIELNDIIQQKNEKITYLKKIEQEYTSLTTQKLEQELLAQSQIASQSNSYSSDFLKQEQLNKYLKIKSELELQINENLKLQQKIAELEQPKAQVNHEEIDPFENDITVRVQRVKVTQQYKEVLNQHIQTDEIKIQINSPSNINEEYLRNVMVKFFEYNEGGNYHQASVLQQAIMTILQISNNDRQRIDQARQQHTIWKSAKSIISDTIIK